MEQIDQQVDFFQQPPQVSATPESAVAAIPVKYAGFWIRCVAYLIDGIIIGLLTLGPLFLILRSFMFSNSTRDYTSPMPAILRIGIIFIPLIFFYGYLIILTYKKEATLGKMAVGIKVISAKNERLSLGQVILRETIGKIISGMILQVGYIMAGFTDKKQALHDMIAKTNVVYKDPNKKIKAWPIIVVAIVFFAIILGLPAIIAMVSLNGAGGKAYDSSVKSSLASVVPLAIAFSNENGSLIGFDLAANPTFSSNFPACSGKPIVNISSDGSQMAIFAKLCSDKKKYFCVDTVDMGQEVDESYALSGKSVCAELSSEQVESVNGSINNMNNNPINSQISPSNLGNAQANDNNLNQSFDKSIISNIRYISSQLEYYKSINKNYKGFLVNEADKPRLMFDVSGCKSKMKIDISPTKEEYVIYAPSCTDPNISFCVEQQVVTGPISPISASTALIEKTYHCQ